MFSQLVEMGAVSLLIALQSCFSRFSQFTVSSKVHRNNILTIIKFLPPALIGHLVLEPNLSFQIRFGAVLMAGRWEWEGRHIHLEFLENLSFLTKKTSVLSC